MFEQFKRFDTNDDFNLDTQEVWKEMELCYLFFNSWICDKSFRGVSMVTGVWGEQMADWLLNIADRYQNFFLTFVIQNSNSLATQTPFGSQRR